MRSKQLSAALLLTVAIAFALAGQYYFLQKRDFFWDAVALYCVAILAFLLLSRRLESISQADRSEGEAIWSRLWVGMRERPWQSACLAVALVSTAATLYITQIARDPNYWWAWRLWLVSVVAYALAFVEGVPKFSWTALQAHRYEVVGVCFLLLAAFLLRVVHLQSIPQNIGGDECSQGLEAIQMITPGYRGNIFATGWLSVPRLSMLWNAPWIKVFGREAFGLRLPWALVGTATVLMVYLLIRRLFHPGWAMATSVLLACFDYHIHYSRLGSNQIADPLFTAAVYYFLLRAVEGKRRLDWALAGIVLGLSWYFYAGARLTTVLVVITLAYFALRQRDFLSQHRDGLLILVVGMLIVGAPLFAWYSKHPDEFNGRLNSVGIFQSGWLDREVQITGKSKAYLLFDQFRRAFLFTNYYPDRVVWYNSPRPLLPLVPAALFMLGFAYAVAHGLELPYFLILAWYMSTVIFGGALTDSPPSSQRLTGLTPGICLFQVVVLSKVLEYIQKIWRLRRWVRQLAMVVLIAAIAIASAHYYFFTFTPLRVYGSPQAEIATEVGRYLRDLNRDHYVYFFGLPRLFLGFATLPYLDPNLWGEDVQNLAQVQPDALRKDAVVVFVFVPERLGDYEWVVSQYPGGYEWRYHLQGKGREHELLFILYQIEA